MTDDVKHWQEDAKAAFTWIATMYDQAQTLWDDAERYYSDAGWQPNNGGGLGGNAMSQSDLSDWPFIYLKALAAVPKESEPATEGTLPIFGICFHDDGRAGPVCFAGSVHWSHEPFADHWALYAALCGYKDRFKRVQESGTPFQSAKPTTTGAKRFPNVKEVRWFEVPLGAISSAKLLKSIVAASIEMAHGNDSDAVAVVGSV